MTKQELVVKALEMNGTSNSKQLSCIIKRKLGIDMTPSAVGGVLRTMVARGQVGKSNCGAGCTMYWLNSPAWEDTND